MIDKKDIKSYTRTELESELKEYGEKAFRAHQIYEWLHVRLVSDFSEMTNISKTLQEKLGEQYYITKLREVECLESALDGTSKFLFELSDGNVIESVLMQYHHGNSVCISSQVGCRMGCKFCASTIGGLIRNLTVSEMLDEIYQIQKKSGKRISNVVVMGTGEPFDNYENLLRFIHLLTDEYGLHISQRNITVSTCGLVEKIRQLAQERLAITLALSLHAPDDATRQSIMPIANRYELSQVIEACDYYFEQTGRRISYEYCLVQGINDKEEQARMLAKLLCGKNCHVNLIPVNAVKERDYQRSNQEMIQSFKKILEKYRINVTIRREMGSDINAACGQLRKSYTDRL